MSVWKGQPSGFCVRNQSACNWFGGQSYYRNTRASMSLLASLERSSSSKTKNKKKLSMFDQWDTLWRYSRRHQEGNGRTDLDEAKRECRKKRDKRWRRRPRKSLLYRREGKKKIFNFVFLNALITSPNPLNIMPYTCIHAYNVTHFRTQL